MDTTIIVAIIGAIATVIAAFIGFFANRHKKESEAKAEKSTLTIAKPAPNNFPEKASNTQNNSKNISADSSSGATIIQADKIEALNIHSGKVESKVDLRLVDVAINEATEGFPVLDVKLRNIGTEVVFLKRAEFQIMKVGVLRDPRDIRYSAEPVSWNYDVALDSRSEGKTIETKISQSLAPNTVDRFTITVGQTGGPLTLYYFCLRLKYNDDNRVIETEPIILPLKSPIKINGMFIAGFRKEVAERNLEIMKEFAKLIGTRSPWASKLLEQAENAS